MQPYYDHAGITIWHADCRDVLPSLGPVDLVLTDPPYGDDHDTDYTRFTRNTSWTSKKHDRIRDDDRCL